MKKLFIITLLAIILPTFAAMAQNEVTLSPNDSLIVELSGYEGGDIFWECSPRIDNENWSIIAAANNQTTLRQKVFIPFYYRSKVVDGTCDPYYSNAIKVNLGVQTVVKAGHGYAEPYSLVETGISMQENGRLSQWTDKSKTPVWYLYQRAGTYEVNMCFRSSVAQAYEFEMNTSPCYDGLNYSPQTFSIRCQGSGNNKADTTRLFTVVIPQTGYYRYELKAKSETKYLAIDCFLFDGFREPGQPGGNPDTHTTKYLSSPSVHLGFSTTDKTSKEYDWVYQEILVPEGYDPLYTYWMSLGFFGGYMGIQTNSDTERRVLFSAWDAIDKDKYPNAPKELLVSLVDKAGYTQANGFGNEGTGGQSFVGTNNPDTWKTGRPVKFLMNSRRDGHIIYEGDKISHAIVSAWYDAGEGWKYIATWRIPRMPGHKDMFDGFYSFLENYGFRNGQIKRKGYYYNCFGREYGSDRWVHFNKAGFGNTDGQVGQRVDFEQGVSDEDPNKFYMVSGGYGQTRKASNQIPLLATIPDFITGLDINAFSKRVDEALEFEAMLKNLETKDKTGWSILSFTSEAATGEPDGNGFASLIIDGDLDTYWHSKWQSGGSSFPHRFVIDMGKEESIKGFRTTSSVGASRYPKNITIEISSTPLPIDSDQWAEGIIVNEQAPQSTTNIFHLDNEATGRYLRFSILSGFSDGVHTRINEIDAF